MNRLRAATILLLLAACASAPPPPREKQAWPGVKETPARDQATLSPVAPPAGAGGEQPSSAGLTVQEAVRLVERDPAAFSARFRRPESCEKAARGVKGASAEAGWKALRICAERGGFTALERLVDGTWDKDFMNRTDGSLVAGRVIAARGGDVAGDLAAFQNRRIPYFTLSTAAENPDIYKGRTVIFLGRVESMEPVGKKAVAWLQEMALVSRGRMVLKDKSEHRSRRAETDNGEKDYEDSVSVHETSTFKYDNAAEETGLQVGAQILAIDPFLQPGKQFLFVGKFLGPRMQDIDGGRETREVSIVNLIAYLPVGVQPME